MTFGGWILIKNSQKTIILRVTSAYRTVTSDPLNILEGILPIELQATEKKQNYKVSKGGRNIAEAKEASK